MEAPFEEIIPRNLVQLIVQALQKLHGDRLEGIILFGSRARGDHGPWSDYDLLVILSSHAQHPLQDYFDTYHALAEFRILTKRDTSIFPISISNLQANPSLGILLNALWEGIILHDRSGAIAKLRRKLLDHLSSRGIFRIKKDWGYSWVMPTPQIPFRLELDLKDPLEYEYRLKLAQEHFSEASSAFRSKLLIAAAHEAELAIQNAAKAVISVFKFPAWVHNPAPELLELVQTQRDQLWRIEHLIQELAQLAEQAAPHHAISSYGDLERMLTPTQIYTESQVAQLVAQAARAVELAREITAILTG